MIVRHRGWAVAVLVAALGLGCHAAKDDPEGQASELAEPVRRFYNDTITTEIHPLNLHDALPI